jgi:F-type H+-transporting ATPase subunit b
MAKSQRDAEALKAQIARDLADLPGMRIRMAQEFRTTAEQQRERVLEQARQAAVRIRKDAELQAEHEVVAAGHTLRRDVIANAVREAVQVIRAGATSDDQSRLVREFASAARAAQ